MDKFIKNYFYNVIYQLFILIIPLITVPYLSRILGASKLGIYSYINSFSSIVSTISLLGIYNYGSRQIAYVRDDKNEQTFVFWEIVVLRIIFCIIGSFIYFITIKNSYYLYFVLYYPWMLSNYLDFSWFFVGQENMKITVIKNFIAKIIGVVGIFIFVKDKNDLDIYILLLSLSSLIANILIIPQLKGYIGNFKLRKNEMLKHLRGSILLFLPQIASLLYLQVDKVMIEIITSATDQLSFYDQAEKIVKIPMTLVTVISTVMMPRLANEFKKGNTQKIESYIIEGGIISLLLCIPMTFGIALIANKFVPWYLGKEYLPTITALIVICPIIISNTLTGISGSQYFVATNKNNILIKSNIIGAITNLVVNIICIPFLGYIGAAIGTVVASYIIVFYQFYYLNKCIKIKQLLIKSYKYLIYSIIMISFTYFLTIKMPFKPTTTILQIIIGIIIYIGQLVIFKDKYFIIIFDKAKKIISR